MRRHLKHLGDPRLQALADQAVVSACNFLTSVILARTLAPLDFGVVSLAILVCLFLANLHRAALVQPYCVLGAVLTPKAQYSRFKGLARLHAPAAILALPIILMAHQWLLHDVPLSGCALLYFVCFGLQELARRHCYTQGRIREALLNDLLSYGGQVALLFGLAVWGQLNGPRAFIIMAATSGLAFCWAMSRMDKPAGTPAMRAVTLIQEHWPMSSWLLLTVLAIWGAGQVYPLLMVPLGATTIAAFTACRNLLNALGLVIQSASNYIPTEAARLLSSQGPAALRRSIVRTCTLALAGGALFVLIIHLTARPLLHLVYGGRYDHADTVLQILALGTVSTLMGAVLGAYALAMEDTKSGFLANLGASTATFTLGLWLIERYGELGAAIGAVVSLSAAALLQGLFVWHRLRGISAK